MEKSAKMFNISCNLFENSSSYNNFILFLKSLSKHESINDIERHKSIINTSQKIIGISMKNIRYIANHISKNCQFEFLEIVKEKQPENSYYEETLIEGLVITCIKDLNLQIKYLEEWIQKIDNWATCDSVVTSLKILKKSKMKDAFYYKFKSWCFSNNEFISRFGIVSIMSIYLNSETIDEIYNLIQNIHNDAYYVKMALSWLIASGFLIDKQKTCNLLKKKSLDKFIQNKAISKCRDSFRVSNQDKEELFLYRM